MSNSRRIEALGIQAVNLKTTGAVLLGTTENGTRKFYPLFVTAECETVTGFLVISIISVGTNASSYNNIVTSLTLTGLSTADGVNKTDAAATAVAIPANTAVYANVTTGTVGTTHTGHIALWGYYK